MKLFIFQENSEGLQRKGYSTFAYRLTRAGLGRSRITVLRRDCLQSSSHTIPHPGCVALIVAFLICCPVARAGPCRPSVVLSGDATIAAAMEKLPVFDGFSKTALPGCPAVWVSVERVGGGLALEITDHLGRVYERTVGDLETAAALIESWARGDALMAALPPSSQVPPEASGKSEPDTPKTPADQKEKTVKESAIGNSIVAGAGFETSVGADGSTWFGGRFHWCTQIGITCIGTLARGGADPMISGRYRHLSDIRSYMEVLLTFWFPISVRRVRVSPTIGFGAGWMQTSYAEEDGDGTTQPDVAESSFGGMRLDVSCRVSVRIHRELTIDLAAGLTTSFIAEEEKVEVNGVTIAGEPRNYLRTGLGLSYRWS